LTLNKRKMDRQDFLLDAEELEDISQDEMDELEKKTEEYVELIEEFEDDLDDVLEEINDTTVYKKLGVVVHVSTEYMYSIGERDED
jgi:hypothetical protein